MSFFETRSAKNWSTRCPAWIRRWLRGLDWPFCSQQTERRTVDGKPRDRTQKYLAQEQHQRTVGYTAATSSIRWKTNISLPQKPCSNMLLANLGTGQPHPTEAQNRRTNRFPKQTRGRCFWITSAHQKHKICALIIMFEYDWSYKLSVLSWVNPALLPRINLPAGLRTTTNLAQNLGFMASQSVLVSSSTNQNTSCVQFHCC